MAPVFWLLPLVILGGIVWGVIALLRRSVGEPFTLVTGVSAYAHLFVIVGAVMLISGVASSIKSGLGFANLHYSYATPPPTDRFAPTLADRERDRADDLVQGLTLALLGGVVLVAHAVIARRTRRRYGGAPAWIVRGTPLLLTVLTAVGGLAAAAAGLHQLLSYALLAAPAGRSPDPFGGQIGYALAFLPIWAGALLWLLRGVRGDGQNAGPARPAAGAEHELPASEGRAMPGPIY